MILEAAYLSIRTDADLDSFEADFKKAAQYISSIKGYIGHNLQRCVETPNRYLLLVQWEQLEDHTIGFRQSSAYQQWKALLHHYYDPFPVVEHFVEVI
ncbi:MAG: antibiotic biosynthesis monooxygenase [Bacteroidota bacterium]